MNTSLRPADRRRFAIDQNDFRPLNDDDQGWCEFLIDALHDWGTGLDIHLYEAALIHFFGENDQYVSETDIHVDDVKIGRQKVRHTTSGAAFKVTALSEHEEKFEQHARRFLSHTMLPTIHWININRHKVRFKTLIRQKAET